MVGRLPTKAQKTDGSHLMWAKAWVFSLEIDNQLTHIRREAPRFIWRSSTLFMEQACHTMLIKLIRLMVQRALTRAGFFGSLRSGFAEKHDGPQQLIDLLFWPESILLNLLPIMGALSALSPAPGHGIHLSN
jgi:hypothetical protein